jgi:hypothetical protein
VDDLARRHAVDSGVLAAWLDYLGIQSGAFLKVEGHYTNQLRNASGYDFIRGWGSTETPQLMANSSDQHVRIPGNMKPHSIAVHPSPKLQAAVGWRAPVTAVLRVDASVTHAHPECGNGVTYSLELRRGATRQRLATGQTAGGKEVKVGPIEKLAVQTGDLISLLIGPRDGNHACDLTAVDLVLTNANDPAQQWGLARETSGDILAGNPHADAQGREDVWHFYTEPVSGSGELGPVVPAGSLLARWQSTETAADKRQLADAIQRLLLDGPAGSGALATNANATAKDSPDAALYRQLASLGGPLLAGARQNRARAASSPSQAPAEAAEWGLPSEAFGRHPRGGEVDAADLCVQAPSLLELRLPADLVAGSEFITTGQLHPATGSEGSVQVQVVTSRPAHPLPLQPSIPIVVQDGSAARQRFESAFADFRRWFPAALCYPRIVPVDEVVTLALFHREDEPLQRLMLDDRQQAAIDGLWEELHYVSHDALATVDAFVQLMEFATQDSDPRLFEPYRKPIHERAAAFREQLVATEPKQLDSLLHFAARAFRRPLKPGEAEEFRALYQKLRGQEIPHDEAFRLVLARVFIAPAFLYRLEKPSPGSEAAPINDWELATRLSYFLWSSVPDAELTRLCAAGTLRQPGVLTAQTQRLLRAGRARRLAKEFACQWLHLHDFEHLDEKSERHFPTFAGLRSAMYEEAIRFFADLFQSDASLLSILDADHTFLNEALAKHYGIPGVTGEDWRRVESVKQHGRGGILGFAATLAKQSGASRTSPILRGNWVAEVLLGDKLPRPPKDVPRLPEDEATEQLTVRQLVEKHSNEPK